MRLPFASGVRGSTLLGGYAMSEKSVNAKLSAVECEEVAVLTKDISRFLDCPIVCPVMKSHDEMRNHLFEVYSLLFASRDKNKDACRRQGFVYAIFRFGTRFGLSANLFQEEQRKRVSHVQPSA